MRNFFEILQHMEENPFYINNIQVIIELKYAIDLKGQWLTVKIGGVVGSTLCFCLLCNQKSHERGIKFDFTKRSTTCFCNLTKCDGKTCKHWKVIEELPRQKDSYLSEGHLVLPRLSKTDLKLMAKENKQELINYAKKMNINFLLDKKNNQKNIEICSIDTITLAIEDWYDCNLIVLYGSQSANTTIDIADAKLVQTNLKIRGFNINVNGINIEENKHLLYKLIREEEDYSRSERWYKENSMVKHVHKMVPDILHVQNRTSNKLFSLLQDELFNTCGGNANRVSIKCTEIEKVINEKALGSPECPSNYKIECIAGKISAFKNTNISTNKNIYLLY